MHNSMNPYGGPNPLIDKMIGNAYDIVKYVAKYLKEIRYVAENMQYVYAAANGGPTKVRVSGTGTGSSDLIIPLPDGVSADNIVGLSVIAKIDNEVCVVNHNFGAIVQGSNLVIDFWSTRLYEAEVHATMTIALE